MTIALIILTALTFTAVGAAIETRTSRPDSDVALRARLDQIESELVDAHRECVRLLAREQLLAQAAARYLRGAKYWYQVAAGHEQILAALGRQVAEGQSIQEDS